MIYYAERRGREKGEVGGGERYLNFIVIAGVLGWLICTIMPVILVYHLLMRVCDIFYLIVLA